MTSTSKPHSAKIFLTQEYQVQMFSEECWHVTNLPVE